MFLFSALSMYAASDKENTSATARLRGSGMCLTENKGQLIDMGGHLRPDVLYAGESGEVGIYLRKTGISYVFAKSETRGEDENGSSILSTARIPQQQSEVTVKQHRIDLDFVNCDPDPVIINSDRVEGHNNYYLSHSLGGITRVYSYNKITYENIYPGIDIVFYGGKECGLKYDIVVRPGGNPNDIKIKYTGTDKLRIESALGGEELKIAHSLGEITENLPKVYQNINGKIVNVIAEYELEGTTLNFKLGTFNSSEALVIDPWANWISTLR